VEFCFGGFRTESNFLSGVQNKTVQTGLVGVHSGIPLAQNEIELEI
jgi:hypothetical protein